MFGIYIRGFSGLFNGNGVFKGLQKPKTELQCFWMPVESCFVIAMSQRIGGGVESHEVSGELGSGSMKSRGFSHASGLFEGLDSQVKGI